MNKPMATVFFGLILLPVLSAAPVWQENFETDSPAFAGLIDKVPARGNALHVTISTNTANPGRVVSIALPVEKLKGQRVFFSADVKTADVSKKPNPWNGVKVMLVVSSPSSKTYPQAETPVGTHDWQRFSSWTAIPGEATNVSMVLGLEQVSGQAWFDDARVVLRPAFRSARKADPAAPIFRGHDLPRLRGAMAGNSLTEEDVRFFGTVWKGNLLRLQLFEAAQKDRALDQYDVWLEERLTYIDRVLGWCEKYGVHAVLDLHSPPGGQAFSAGYITARGRIFMDPKAQEKFVEVWQKMTQHYKGRKIIWGFDLVNEPDDAQLGEDCLDWNSLADKAARAVHSIDPDRTLIIEPNSWGGPQGFASFEPLDLTNVVYSFHFYQPMAFTHQGIHGNSAGVTYPGEIAKEHWDKAALERAMAPALDFAKKHRVHMYVGEFSAIRTAPGNSAGAYLSDVISIFEKHEFDWSYHAYREWEGWSVEHEGSLEHPRKAESPTDREKVLTSWFAKNKH